MKGSRGKVSLAVCLVVAAVSAPQALAGHIRLVSTDSAGHVGVGTSDYADITADGRYVVFDTEAPLVPEDDNAFNDVYLKDLQTGQTTLVSRANGTGAVSENGSSFEASISDDGRYVAFVTVARDLTDPALPVPGRREGSSHILVRDLMLGTTILADSTDDGSPVVGGADLPALSADGRYVVFGDLGALLPDDGRVRSNDIYMKDLVTGHLTRVTSQADGSDLAGGNAAAVEADISADGRYVAFAAGGDIDPQDTDGQQTDVYIKDMQTNEFRLVSKDASGQAVGGDLNPYGSHDALSDDGRYVVFETAAALTADDSNGQVEPYVADLQGGTMTRVLAPLEPNAYSSDDTAALSANGRYVAFSTYATNIDASTASPNVFVRDLGSGTLTRVSTNDAGIPSQYAHRTTVTNGGLAAFAANAPLLPDDVNGQYDVYVADPALAPAVSPGGPIVPAGGSVETSGTPTPDDPVTVNLFTPVATQVSFTETSSPAPPPAGYSFFGEQIQIETGGVQATAAQPFQITFRVDPSLLDGVDHTTVQIFRNGVPIPDCTVQDGTATPDPCVASRSTTFNDGVMLLVYTSHASRWNFGATATAATDSTAPVITPQLAGTLGLDGWYTGDVSLTWLVSDPESTISSQSGCGPAPQTVIADTSGQSFTCMASSAGGNAQQTVTIKRDATKPTLAFSSHPSSYAVDQTVNITCQAQDVTSGLSSQTCPQAQGPAYTFGLGAHTLSASASDNAGNSASAETSFTVTVTPASLCNVTVSMVKGSTKYLALPSKSRAAVDALSQVACDAVAKITAKTTGNSKQGFVTAYKVAVDVLLKAGWLTASQDATLKTLATGL